MAFGTCIQEEGQFKKEPGHMTEFWRWIEPNRANSRPEPWLVDLARAFNAVNSCTLANSTRNT